MLSGGGRHGNGGSHKQLVRNVGFSACGRCKTGSGALGSPVPDSHGLTSQKVLRPIDSLVQFLNCVSILGASQGEGLLGELPIFANRMDQPGQGFLAILERASDGFLDDSTFQIDRFSGRLLTLNPGRILEHIPNFLEDFPGPLPGGARCLQFVQ